ncbi:MAG: hypothetical protein WDN23_21130 [Edaphobacter sp.]
MRPEECGGTQSFVHTLSECWRRPSLTALEVLWRWAYGVPALLVLWHAGERILRETPVDIAALKAISVTDPMGAATTLAKALEVLLPPVLGVLVWACASAGGWLGGGVLGWADACVAQGGPASAQQSRHADCAANRSVWWYCWAASRCGSGAWSR